MLHELELAPTAAQARVLSCSRIAAALRRGGRQRNLEVRAEQIQIALRSPQLEQPPLIAEAFGAAVSAYVAVLASSVAQLRVLEEQLEASFGQHPAAEIVLSQPGLGAILGARVLAEFGADAHRYASAKARKIYAGTPPITRACGLRRVVLARMATNAYATRYTCRLSRPSTPVLAPAPTTTPDAPMATPPPGAARRQQPFSRDAARLLAPRHPLQRGVRLAPLSPPGSRGRLTPYSRGMSWGMVAGCSDVGDLFG